MPSRSAASTSAAGTSAGDDEGDVAVRHGVGREPAGLDHRVAGGAEHVDVELGGTGPGRQAERGERLGVQLTRVADQRAVGQREPGAAAGVPWCVLVRGDRQVDGQGRAQGARRADGVGPVGGPSGTPPAAAVGVAGEDEGDPARLVRHRREDLLQRLVVGARRRRRGPVRPAAAARAG